MKKVIRKGRRSNIKSQFDNSEAEQKPNVLPNPNAQQRTEDKILVKA